MTADAAEPVHLVDLGTAVCLRAGGVQLLRYEYRPVMPAEHAPRPYLHPVATRAGVVVTDVAPADHPWHYGVSLAVPTLAGDSFWGGPTYLRDKGYVALDNHGRVKHLDWLEQRVDGPAATLRHRLVWTGHDGRRLLDEERTLMARLDDDPARWTLAIHSRLHNPTDAAVELGSPATAGRAGAGYGGWFVRAAPCFRDGDVEDSEGHHGDDAFGRYAATLRLSCPEAGIAMDADPDNPEPWFFRRTEYPGLGPALAVDRPTLIPPGDCVTRGYQLHMVDRVG